MRASSRTALAVCAGALLSGCPPLPIPSTYYLPSGDGATIEPQGCSGAPAQTAQFLEAGVKTRASFNGRRISIVFYRTRDTSIDLDATLARVQLGNERLALQNMRFWQFRGGPSESELPADGHARVTGTLILNSVSPFRDPQELILYIPPVSVDGVMLQPHTVEFHRVHKVHWQYVIINC